MRFVHPTTEPLGLTRGSVRSILAILLTVAVIAGGFGFVATGALDAKEVWAGLLPLVATIINRYFESRPNSPAPLTVTLGTPKE